MTYGIRLVAASTVLLASLLYGCASTPQVRFYALSPVKQAVTPGAAVSTQTRFTVGVGPVEIPDYLERPHIVVRNGQNERVMAEYDRWAGSLKQDIARVLVEDLTSFLPPGVAVISWKRSVSMDCRVAVEVTRLDVIPGSSVTLSAQWAMFVKDQKTPASLRSLTFTQPVEEKDFSAIVSAIGTTLGRLSESIADDIRAKATVTGSKS